MASFLFQRALLPQGWADEVSVEVDELGLIRAVDVGEGPLREAQRVEGVALPGMPNLHSHAFQRALAGLAEYRAGRGDSFWSWRELMYRFVARITPEQLGAITAGLYLEMLRAGYTSVAEFHYLHHAPGGVAYDEPAALSIAVMQAARRTGIALTHFPVLYMTAGFDGTPCSEQQARFAHADVGAFLRLLHRLRQETADDAQIDVGVAPHSLRAVPAEAMQELLDGCGHGPLHIHIAEQQREVEECIAHRGARPVQWLFDHCAPDAGWCLVHATHMDEGERRNLARSGAVAGLCPTTEANLGDGLFPLQEYCEDDGIFGVGSDSNSSVSPLEELRWLEYGQRLLRQRRNIVATESRPHVGEHLWRSACEGGGRALGRPCGAIAAGQRADIVVLDPAHPSLVGRRDSQLLDSLVFAGNGNPVRDVICGGRRVIEAGRHAQQESIERDFHAALLACADW